MRSAADTRSSMSPTRDPNHIIRQTKSPSRSFYGFFDDSVPAFRNFFGKIFPLSSYTFRVLPLRILLLGDFLRKYLQVSSMSASISIPIELRSISMFDECGLRWGKFATQISPLILSKIFFWNFFLYILY